MAGNILEFQVGRKYSRGDVKELAGLGRNAKGGPWDTGIVEHYGQFLIFANVGTEGRTGDNYDNRWDGELFHWYHKKGSVLKWPSVRRLLDEESYVHVFWRSSNRAPFVYAGKAQPLHVFDKCPVEILWSFDNEVSDVGFFQGPDEVAPKEYMEGTVRQVQVNSYERDPSARLACINHYGPACVVCGLVFEERYGALGTGYIHVHHLVPVSEIGKSYKVDPIKDLRPICPNCHAMVHRRRPPLPIEDVRERLITQGSLLL